MRVRFAVLLIALGMIAGCASPESQLRAGLMNAGLSRPMAGCMAQRMTDRLSLLQLRRIGALRNLRDESIRDMTTARFLRNIRALNDPEIVSVASTALVVCAIP